MTNDLRYGLYYTTRYLVWEFAIFLLIAIVFPGALVAFRTIQKFSDSLWTTMWLFQAILMTAYLFLCYLASRFALQKVFFEPYKRFRVETKIEKIKAGIILRFLALRLFAFCLIACISGLVLAPFDIDIKSDFIFALFGLFTQILVTFFILRGVVLKYATISEI